MLYAFLSGTETPGAWNVFLDDSLAHTLLLDEPGATTNAANDAASCSKLPSLNACSTNLAIAATAAGGLTLSGSATVPDSFPATISLNTVQTLLAFCPMTTSQNSPQLSGALSSVAPSACLASSAVVSTAANQFTATTLAAAVPVSPGQTVSVTVTITFTGAS